MAPASRRPGQTFGRRVWSWNIRNGGSRDGQYEKGPGQPRTPAVASNARQASLVIESPKQGATVSMREELTGRVESEGWPVIFVQADIPGQPWWCQAPVEKVDGGRFSDERRLR